MSSNHEDSIPTTIKAGILLVVAVVISLIGFWIWYANWVNFVDTHELGFVYNKRTGQVKILPETGWVIATPWIEDVHRVDLRPSQVCMNANQRVLNCKLVQFNPKGLQVFISWHGRDAGDDSFRMYEILKSYAFNINEGRDCPFLTILDDMRRKDLGTNIVVR